jgi:putative SOS response-associated peptidase YedK
MRVERPGRSDYFDRASGERHFDVLKWGLVPYFTKGPKPTRKPINARSETVALSGMFKAAFADRRCLVPGANSHVGCSFGDGFTVLNGRAMDSGGR